MATGFIQLPTRLQQVKVQAGVIGDIFYGPKRSALNHDAGGTHMRAVLGPDCGAGWPHGTNPVSAPGMKAIIKQLNALGDGLGWKGGHLLNGDLGGRGDDMRNLTPITGRANGDHSTFEDYLKALLITCNLFERNNPQHPYWYGAAYEVMVMQTPFVLLGVPGPGSLYHFPMEGFWYQFQLVFFNKSIALDPNSHTYYQQPGNDQPLPDPNLPGAPPAHAPFYAQVIASGVDTPPAPLVSPYQPLWLESLNH